jgi:phosphatidate phosphatase
VDYHYQLEQCFAADDKKKLYSQLWGRLNKAAAMWKQLRVLAVNVILIVIVGVAWMGIRATEPTHLGFYCSDTSISKPYQNSSVTSSMLYSIAYIVPAIIIFVRELYGQNGGEENIWKWRVTFHLRTIPAVLVATLKTYLNYVFAAFATILITNIGKVISGRLRPHFLDVCRPDWDAITCTTNDGIPLYVTNYICLGNEDMFEDEWESKISEARHSFPSGHTSYSFQAATFCILYLQVWVFPLTNKTFFVPFLQLVFFCMAFATGLSRVMDFKHHPMDVLAGMVIGIAIQTFNVLCILRPGSKETKSGEFSNASPREDLVSKRVRDCASKRHPDVEEGADASQI